MTKEEKFDKFWTYYPRKVAKVAAQRSWKRLKVKDIEAIFSVYKEHLIRWKYKDIHRHRWNGNSIHLPCCDRGIR